MSVVLNNIIEHLALSSRSILLRNMTDLEKLLQKYWESELVNSETAEVIGFGKITSVYHEYKLVEVAFEVRTRKGKSVMKEGKIIR